MRRSLVLALGVTAWFTGLLGGAASSAADQGATDSRAAAWTHLWSNDFAEAESAFAALAAADKKDAEALRGLILAQLARGKDDEAVASLKSYTRLLPASPYDMLLPDLVDQNTGLSSRAFYDVLLDYAKRLREAKGLSVVDRRRATILAIKYALNAGRADEARRLTQSLNRVQYWALLGPFDNTSGCGHKRMHLANWSYSPETVSGKFGQKINWFKPLLVGNDNSITPNRYFSRDTYTTAYLRTNFDLPRAGTYLVSVSYRGDMTFLLNRTVVHEGSRLAGADELLHWLVDLPAGPNRLAFKISNRDDDGRLACGISLPDGSPVPGIQFYQFKNAMPDSGAYSPPSRVQSEILAEIASKAATSPADAEAGFWNLQRAALESAPDSVQSIVDGLAADLKRSALVRLAVSAALEKAGDTDGANRALTDSTAVNSGLVQAKLAKAAKDLERKRADSALAAARAILNQAPLCRRALAMEAAALKERQDMEELQRLGAALAVRLADDPLPWRMQLDYAESRGDKNAARRCRNAYIKRLPPTARDFLRIKEHFEKDDPAAARDALESMVEFAPDVAWLWRMLVVSLIAGDEVPRARVLLDQVLTSFPQDVALLDLKSRLVEAGAYTRALPPGELIIGPPTKVQIRRIRDAWDQANRESAAELLQRALENDPSNFELRDRIRTLRGEPSYRTFLPDPKVEDITKRRVEASSHPGEDAVVLLDQRRRFLFDARADLRDQVLAVQVLTAAGVEQWENYSWPLSREMNDLVVLASEVIKPDDSRHEARQLPTGILFSNAEPGDLLFLHYQVTAHSDGALASEVWDQHLFPFPHARCLESSYALIRPTALSIKSELWNAQSLANASYQKSFPADGFRQDLWRFTNLEAVDAEPLAASALAHAPWLDISTIEDWNTIARWYSDLAEGQVELTAAIRKKAAELTAGAGDDEERMRRLLRYVGNEITYQSVPFFQSAHVPRPAGEVLRDRLGDCKDKCCLLIALARAAGVAGSSFALTTPGAPPGVAFLPSPRFNHVVVRWRQPDGRCRWLDPTVRHAGLDQVPLMLAGAPALVAGEIGGGLVRIDAPDIERSPVEAATKLIIAPSGDAALSCRIVHRRGDRLSRLRSQLESLSDKKLADDIAAQLAPQFPGVRVPAVAVHGRGDADSALVYEYQASIPELAQIDAGLVSLRLPWITSIDDLLGVVVAKQERLTPIDLRPLNVAEDEEVTLNLPPPGITATLPEGNSLTWKDCSYATSFRRAGSELIAQRTLVIKGPLVTTQEYPAFKAFLEGVRRDLRRTYHLRQQ